MKFRKLYWVTEQVGECGCSTVAGVYTSIHDLLNRGVRWMEGIEHDHSYRISLVQLDSIQKPLGTWSAPAFDHLENDLQHYVQTNEMTESEILELGTGLRRFYEEKA
ncbi:MAG: hypothetical protein KIT11_04285 [Fimbriimonadaceae bacterium]|nr:hypothetical protein [Fimbriimonadaceae bacterium]QYK56886.1 MAG: hypothetical protein KF733_05240 [Fimbriimonadaceae bacterium]